MQTIIMTDMMPTTVKIQPYGQPVGPEDQHRMALLAEGKQKRARARRKVWRTLSLKLVKNLDRSSLSQSQLT